MENLSDFLNLTPFFLHMPFFMLKKAFMGLCPSSKNGYSRYSRFIGRTVIPQKERNRYISESSP